MTDYDPATANVIINRLLDRLAIVTGLFGSHGWGEVQVTQDDGTTEHLPVVTHIQEKIIYARKVLKEFGRNPITT